MPEISDMPGLDEAIARLDAAEAAESQNYSQPDPTPEAEPTDPQQPGDTPDDGSTKPDSLPNDTPAAPDTAKPPEPKTEPIKKPDAKMDAGKFAKDKQRRDDSWKALNTEKDTHKKAVEQFQAERSNFQREQQTFQQKQAKASAKYTPEQYEQTASSKLQVSENLSLQADGLERRSEQLEDAGKLLEAKQAKQQAQEKREEALAEKGLARQLKSLADELRKNPDPTAEQVKQKQQADLKHYTLEAAKKWPDIAKEGSEFQKNVANHLQEAARQGMDPNEHPTLVYHAARLTAAESASARVPSMEKELGELRAKVKELEALTNPGGGTTAASKIPGESAKTDDEEFAELRQAAMAR